MKERTYVGVDYFRVIAAFLVVAIHTSPFTSYSIPFDFFTTRIVARVAVPFFLMATGYFLLSRFAVNQDIGTDSLYRFFKKTVFLYGISILIYIPINLYAGQFTGENIVRLLLFDGTMYHLWYLPAAILGTIIVFMLLKKGTVFALTVSVILYLIGLFGDSYYGLAAQAPVLQSFYNGIFSIVSYTRNGLFYAPIFLMLGCLLGMKKNKMKIAPALAGFLFFLFVMSAEGFMLNYMEWQRHDSMYIALIPCMYFLFAFLMTFQGKTVASLASISMVIYVIHPLMIILVRGFGKVSGTSNLLVENSLIHYIAVSLTSLIFALLVWKIQVRFQSRIS